MGRPERILAVVSHKHFLRAMKEEFSIPEDKEIQRPLTNAEIQPFHLCDPDKKDEAATEEIAPGVQLKEQAAANGSISGTTTDEATMDVATTTTDGEGSVANDAKSDL